MNAAGRHFSGALTLAIGLVFGWGLANLSIPRGFVRAQGGDRSGDSVVASGPVLIRYNDGHRVQIPLDALYYLDYKSGRLLATIPSYRQTAATTKILDTFAERDLVADFKLDADNGPRPHFLMTTGTLGQYSEGWAPLFVFESTTSQVAVYKVQQQSTGVNSVPKFDLVEIRSVVPPSAAQPAQESGRVR